MQRIVLRDGDGRRKSREKGGTSDDDKVLVKRTKWYREIPGDD
jgi:hypothetical protein